jgi:hypothetical protein
METESSLRNVSKYKPDVVSDKNRMMDNVQKHNICMNEDSYKILSVLLRGNSNITGIISSYLITWEPS